MLELLIEALAEIFGFEKPPPQQQRRKAPQQAQPRQAKPAPLPRQPEPAMTMVPPPNVVEKKYRQAQPYAPKPAVQPQKRAQTPPQPAVRPAATTADYAALLRNNPEAARAAFVFSEIFGRPLADR